MECVLRLSVSKRLALFLSPAFLPGLRVVVDSGRGFPKNAACGVVCTATYAVPMIFIYFYPPMVYMVYGIWYMPRIHLGWL